VKLKVPQQKPVDTVVVGEPTGTESPPSAATPHVPATERGDRVWNRTLAVGVLLAVVIHVGILLSTRTAWIPTSSLSAAGPSARDARASAGGGGGMEVVQVRIEEDRAAAEDPVPVPEPVPTLEEPEEEPEVEPQPEPTPSPALAASTPGRGQLGEGPAEGQVTGPGLVEGTGRGGGGADAEGTGGIIAPVPRGMILPPSDPPRSVRGREYRIWVFVSQQGRVVADSTRLDPPTPDSRYNRRISQRAAEWSFEPARREGQVVGAWFEYVVEF
jgi:hypothetical protein